MTPAELEQGHRETTVNINMVLVFAFFLILPYILFFGLLMLLTGQIDVLLLYSAVMQKNDPVVIKAWVIGMFVLSVASTAYVSIYRTEKYLVRRLSHHSGGSVGSAKVPESFVMESPEKVEETEESKTRHSGLGNVIDDKDQ